MMLLSNIDKLFSMELANIVTTHFFGTSSELDDILRFDFDFDFDGDDDDDKKSSIEEDCDKGDVNLGGILVGILLMGIFEIEL